MSTATRDLSPAADDPADRRFGATLPRRRPTSP